MKLIRYVCSHCGRKFEAEEKENLECPGCFWTSSVKKEEDLEARSRPDPQAAVASVKSNLSPALSRIFPVLIGGVSLAALAVLFVMLWPQVDRALRLSDRLIRFPQGKESAPVPNPGAETRVFGLESLTEEEKNILYRKMQFSADRPLSEAEKKILDHRVAFKTGLIEKLPSGSWTLEQFKEMIAEQERFYKIALPGSYKDKLEESFKKKYLAAEEAFKAGDLVKARDLWVESLAFPVYAKDVRKHRGVVLTMLRTFINDTLSKIGAINSTIVEGKIREKEKSVSETYAELLKLIGQKSWPEALAAVLTLDQKLDELENPSLTAASPPGYPPAITQVDGDIRQTLADILSPPPPAVADLVPMRQDIREKRKVMESFLQVNLDKVQGDYDEAVEHIHRREWLEAEKKLREIGYPLELAEDAAEKVKILKRLQNSGLASEGKQG